jgi:hypothetical protein
MAWFYNRILADFSRIGLLATLLRRLGPAATMVRKSTFFLTNSHFFLNLARQKRQKTRFSLACSTRPISAILACGKEPNCLFSDVLVLTPS